MHMHVGPLYRFPHVTVCVYMRVCACVYVPVTVCCRFHSNVQCMGSTLDSPSRRIQQLRGWKFDFIGRKVRVRFPSRALFCRDAQ